MNEKKDSTSSSDGIVVFQVYASLINSERETLWARHNACCRAIRSTKSGSQDWVTEVALQYATGRSSEGFVGGSKVNPSALQINPANPR